VRRSPSGSKPGKVFGRDLEDLLEQQGQDIPILVQQTTAWLEEHGLDEEGLFRISGNKSSEDSLRSKYESDPKARVDFAKENVSNHTVAGLLKLFLRCLPEPLLLYRYYSTFLKVHKNEDMKARLANFRILVQKLPKSNQLCLFHILRFLKKVSEHSSTNMMTLTNLATCWAPNLLQAPPEQETAESLMIDAGAVTDLVCILIREVEFLASSKQSLLQKAMLHDQGTAGSSNESIPSRTSTPSSSCESIPTRPFTPPLSIPIPVVATIPTDDSNTTTNTNQDVITATSNTATSETTTTSLINNTDATFVGSEDLPPKPQVIDEPTI